MDNKLCSLDLKFKKKLQRNTESSTVKDSRDKKILILKDG